MKTNKLFLAAALGLALAFGSFAATSHAATPAGGAAIATATLKIQLTWECDDNTEYRIYELTAPETWTLVKTITGAPAPKSGLLEGVSRAVHTYAVTAVNVDGESSRSPSASNVVPALTPINLRVEVVATVTINLSVP